MCLYLEVHCTNVSISYHNILANRWSGQSVGVVQKFRNRILEPEPFPIKPRPIDYAGTY